MKWEKYFGDAFRLTNRSITKDQPVVIYANEYMKKLNRLLEEYIGKRQTPDKKL